MTLHAPESRAESTEAADPLSDISLIVRLLSSVTSEPPEQVLTRLRSEFENPGSAVAAEAQRRNVEPFVQSRALDALYSESDVFLYESAIWNCNLLKKRIRTRVRRRLSEYRKRLKRDALDILVIGDGPGFDSLELARAGHRVTYHELPGFQETFARRLFELCAADITIITDRDAIAERAFDAVVCLDVLEHVDDPPSVVRSLTGYLREGGLFIVHAPFYMIHPAYPTHLRSNRTFSGRMKLYRDAGLRLVHGSIGWNPLVFSLGSERKLLKPMNALKRLGLRCAGAYLALGRWSALPFLPVHRSRRANGRWFGESR